MTSEEKIELIKRWSYWFYDHTSTFDGAIGRQLAYLWPAIINDHQIAVTNKSAIVKLLDKYNIPRSADIWEFIDIEV